MLMNKAQTCSFLGWSSADFDRNQSSGFPARKASRSRGVDWQVDSVQAVAWVVNQALAEAGLVAAGTGPLDAEQERARRDKGQADKLDLEVRRMRGELLDRATLERALAVIDGALKD